MSKSLKFSEIEAKILSLALEDDNRVQQFHSKEVFNCNYLPDHIQHLRPKLERHFKADGMEILLTEFHTIERTDGKNTRFGIYRINDLYKKQIKALLDDNQEVQDDSK